MGLNDWFDVVFMRLCAKVPLLGESLLVYYTDHDWFKRLTKFGFTTVILYWLLKAPMVWILTQFIPKTYFFVPGYIWATFFSGIILTIASFIVSEGWIWRKRR